VKTHKEIARLKNEFGRRIPHTEKVLYLGFQNGKLIEGHNQFAVGDRPGSRKAREYRLLGRSRHTSSTAP
jgi:hypothetical protein